MITPPVSPGQETLEENTEKTTDTPDGTQQTGQNESVSSEEYLSPERNGTNMETFLPSKPQTSRHKFLAAGQQKSLSSGNVFERQESDEDENLSTLVENCESHKDSAECMQDQISKETGNESIQLPDVKVDQRNQIDNNLDNLFNV